MLQAVRLRGLYQSFAKINDGHPDAGGVIALYKDDNAAYGGRPRLRIDIQRGRSEADRERDGI